MRKLTAAIAVFLMCALFPAAPAHAHAALLRTDPAAGAVVPESPGRVSLYFSEAVQVVPGQLKIIGPDGGRADSGPPQVADGQVTLGMSAEAARGTYLVTYRVLSADSHPIAGGFSFSIGAPSSSSPAVSGGGGAEVDPVVSVALLVARYLGYVGFALLVGPVLLALFLWPRRLQSPGRLVWTGVALIAVGTVAGLYLQAPYSTGSSLFEVTGADLEEVLARTRFGFAGQVRLAVLVVAIPFLIRVLKGIAAATDRILLGVLVVAGALTWPIAGHPSAARAPLLMIAADAMHLLAMAVWFGGLVGLAGYLLRQGNKKELGAVLPVWSRWAGWAVTVLAVTGMAQVLITVPTPSALLATRYGQLLLIKVGLFAVILGAAWFARRRVRASGVRMRGLVLFEVAVISVVLAVTAVLVRTTPPRPDGAGSEAVSVPYSTTLTSRYYQLQVQIDPARVGNNAVHLYASTPRGTPITVAEWRVTAALPAKGVAPIDVPVLPLDGEHATGQVTLPIAGEWEMRFTLRVSEIEQATVTQTVNID